MNAAMSGLAAADISATEAMTNLGHAVSESVMSSNDNSQLPQFTRVRVTPDGVGAPHEFEVVTESSTDGVSWVSAEANAVGVGVSHNLIVEGSTDAVGWMPTVTAAAHAGRGIPTTSVIQQQIADTLGIDVSRLRVDVRRMNDIAGTLVSICIRSQDMRRHVETSVMLSDIQIAQGRWSYCQDIVNNVARSALLEAARAASERNIVAQELTRSSNYMTSAPLLNTSTARLSTRPSPLGYVTAVSPPRFDFVEGLRMQLVGYLGLGHGDVGLSVRTTNFTPDGYSFTCPPTYALHPIVRDDFTYTLDDFPRLAHEVDVLLGRTAAVDETPKRRQVSPGGLR